MVRMTKPRSGQGRVQGELLLQAEFIIEIEEHFLETFDILTHLQIRSQLLVLFHCRPKQIRIPLIKYSIS